MHFQPPRQHNDCNENVHAHFQRAPPTGGALQRKKPDTSRALNLQFKSNSHCPFLSQASHTHSQKFCSANDCHRNNKVCHRWWHCHDSTTGQATAALERLANHSMSPAERSLSAAQAAWARSSQAFFACTGLSRDTTVGRQHCTALHRSNVHTMYGSDKIHPPTTAYCCLPCLMGYQVAALLLPAPLLLRWMAKEAPARTHSPHTPTTAPCALCAHSGAHSS